MNSCLCRMLLFEATPLDSIPAFCHSLKFLKRPITFSEASRKLFHQPLEMSAHSAPLTLLALCLMLSSVLSGSLPGPWEPGRATFYEGWNTGNCGYGQIPTSSFPFSNIVALNSAWYAIL